MIKNPKIWLLFIIVIATFLRFYGLSEYLRFLGDEGRDVLVVKKMIVDHQWTLLGPTASVGGFYTGPIYYYFMLPFLWVFGLNPIGPAVMAALFGLVTIVLIWLFCKEFFDPKTALIAAFFMAISPKMVETSRFSWNPNPIPFFSLLTIFSLYLAKVRDKKIFTLLTGIGLGILYQLHYINLVFIPIVGLATLLLFPNKRWLGQIALIILGFLVGNSFFLAFELRHGFPNTKSVLEFIFRDGKTVAPRSPNFIWLINDITRILYEIVFGFRGATLNIIYYLSFIFLSYWSFKNYREQKEKVIVLIIWWLLGAFGVGLYRGTLLDHYFEYLFPVPIIFVSILGGKLLKKKTYYPLFLILIGTILYLSLPKLFLFTKPNNLLAQTQAVDKIVLEITNDQPFNFALIAPGNSDHAYRYFLEIWGRPPVTIDPPQSDSQRKSVTDQLIVVCESKCAPQGNSQWEIAGFGQGEITQIKEGPAGIKVFKMLHYKGG